MRQDFEDEMNAKLQSAFGAPGASDMTFREQMLCDALLTAARMVDWLDKRIAAMETHPALSIPALPDQPLL